MIQDHIDRTHPSYYVWASKESMVLMMQLMN